MLLLKTAYRMVGNILVIQTVEKGIFKKQIKQFCTFRYIFKTKNQFMKNLKQIYTCLRNLICAQAILKGVFVHKIK